MVLQCLGKEFFGSQNSFSSAPTLAINMTGPLDRVKLIIISCRIAIVPREALNTDELGDKPMVSLLDLQNKSVDFLQLNCTVRHLSHLYTEPNCPPRQIIHVRSPVKTN